jgi:hypothetical protein
VAKHLSSIGAVRPGALILAAVNNSGEWALAAKRAKTYTVNASNDPPTTHVAWAQV